MVNYTGRGLVVKRPGVLSKVQILTLVLGVGVFSPEWILHERFFSSHEFSYEKCSEIFPENFEPLFCGSEKISGKFPPNFPLNFPNFPAKNQKKIHRWASAGAQGEHFTWIGHTPTGSYSRKGVLLPSRCLLESPFLEPLLRTLLRTLLPIKSHCKTPSKNPSGQNLLESSLKNPSKNPLLRRVRCCTPRLVCALLEPRYGKGMSAAKVIRRQPDYSSNLCPPKTFAIWLFGECFGPPSCCFSYIKGWKHPPKKSSLRRTHIRWEFWQSSSNSQSPASHWMAKTSSLNCLSCRIPYQSLHALNAFPWFSERALLFSDFCFVASPSLNSVPIYDTKVCDTK